MVYHLKDHLLPVAAALLLALQLIASSAATGLPAHPSTSGNTARGIAAVSHSEAAPAAVPVLPLPLKRHCNSTTGVCPDEAEVMTEEASSASPEAERMMESFTSGRLLLQQGKYISNEALKPDSAVFGGGARARPYMGRSCNPIYLCR